MRMERQRFQDHFGGSMPTFFSFLNFKNAPLHNSDISDIVT